MYTALAGDRVEAYWRVPRQRRTLPPIHIHTQSMYEKEIVSQRWKEAVDRRGCWRCLDASRTKNISMERNTTASVDHMSARRLHAAPTRLLAIASPPVLKLDRISETFLPKPPPLFYWEVRHFNSCVKETILFIQMPKLSTYISMKITDYRHNVLSK